MCAIKVEQYGKQDGTVTKSIDITACGNPGSGDGSGLKNDVFTESTDITACSTSDGSGYRKMTLTRSLVTLLLAAQVTVVVTER